MQSIKNTSAQIVSKSQHCLFNSRLDATLVGHKDGITDVNCLPVPMPLLLATPNTADATNGCNLLIGTASVDTTARLWYFNMHSRASAVTHQLSPHSTSTSLGQTSPPSCNNKQHESAAFCFQEYCGHAGAVNSIRFHPRFFSDATNLILTGSGDCEAHIWQSVLSPEVDSLESNSQVVLNYHSCYSIAMSSAGSRSPLADMISNPAVIRSPIRRYQGHTDACIAAEWFPDGEQLVTGSWDRTANVYNVETAKVLCNLQHDDQLTNVSMHRAHKIILTSSKDTTFKIWDFRDPICSVQIYQGHSRSVNSAIFIGDDKIATSSDDQTLKMWDLRLMRSPLFSINLNSCVNRICSMTATANDFSASGSSAADQTFLCIPLDNRDIKIYNLAGERILRLPRSNRLGHTRPVTSLASYGGLLFSASYDKLVNCWSFDYTPPKSTSSASSSSSGSSSSSAAATVANTNKSSSLNKENSEFFFHFNDLNVKGSSSSNAKPTNTKKSSEISSYSSSSPPTSHLGASGSVRLGQQHIVPSGNNNNNNTPTSRNMNSIAKLTELIKI
jgi:WD40 repeat protein